MKKKFMIGIGTFLAVFLLMLAPSISAIEYDAYSDNADKIVLRDLKKSLTINILEELPPNTLLKTIIEIIIILSTKALIRGTILTLFTKMDFKQAYKLSFLTAFIAALLLCTSVRLYAKYLAESG